MLSWRWCTRPVSSMLCLSWSASGYHVTSSRDAIRCQGAFRESWAWTKPLTISSCLAFLFSAAKTPSGLVLLCFSSSCFLVWWAMNWNSHLNTEPWCLWDPSVCMSRNIAPQKVVLVPSESWPGGCEHPHSPAEQDVIGGLPGSFCLSLQLSTVICGSAVW